MWYDFEELIPIMQEYCPIVFSQDIYVRGYWTGNPNNDTSEYVKESEIQLVYNSKEIHIDIHRGTYCEGVDGPYLEGTERGYLGIGYSYNFSSESNQGGGSITGNTPEAFKNAMEHVMETLRIDYKQVQQSLF